MKPRKLTFEDLLPKEQTTAQQFRDELVRLQGIAVKSGWTTFHVADALGIPAVKLKAWMRGEDGPTTGHGRDQALTMIVRKLELRPL